MSLRWKLSFDEPPFHAVPGYSASIGLFSRPESMTLGHNQQHTAANTVRKQYFNIEFTMMISNRTYGIIVRTNRMSASQLYAIFYTTSTIVQITQNAHFYLLIFIQQRRLT